MYEYDLFVAELRRNRDRLQFGLCPSGYFIYTVDLKNIQRVLRVTG